MNTSIVINNVVANNEAVYQPQPTDYVGEDGIYCDTCITPNQNSNDCMSNEKKPFVSCGFDKKNQEILEAERRQFERETRLMFSRSLCFPDNRLCTWSFENCDDMNDPLIQTMLRYCENFDEEYRDGIGMMLYGEVGIGKSYGAACVANYLLEHDRSVHMTDFSRIINILWGLNSGKQKYLDDLNRYDLLIIDDLAAERNTPYANEIVMNVVDSRCRSGKPMIVTTNLSPEEILVPSELSRQRVYSRLCEMCVPVPCKGFNDRRKEKMKLNIAKYKDRLGLS